MNCRFLRVLSAITFISSLAFSAGHEGPPDKPAGQSAAAALARSAYDCIEGLQQAGLWHEAGGMGYERYGVIQVGGYLLTKDNAYRMNWNSLIGKPEALVGRNGFRVPLPNSQKSLKLVNAGDPSRPRWTFLPVCPEENLDALPEKRLESWDPQSNKFQISEPIRNAIQHAWNTLADVQKLMKERPNDPAIAAYAKQLGIPDKVDEQLAPKIHACTSGFLGAASGKEESALEKKSLKLLNIAAQGKKPSLADLTD